MTVKVNNESLKDLLSPKADSQLLGTPKVLAEGTSCHKAVCKALTAKILAYNSSMEIEKLLKSQKEQILAIARKNGAYDVRVFGSVARGEARADSDIDFLVKLETGRSLLDLARLLRELQTLLGLPVDVVTEAGLRPRIRPQVLKDARPL